MEVWNEVLTGLVLVAGGYWVIRTIWQWRLFRRSVYIEIYSGYIEYAFRKKSIPRLSESFYLKNEFGKHRIFYQIAQEKGADRPQAYILLLLNTGIYILNIKNQIGEVVLKKHGGGEGKSPVEECRIFENRLRQRLGNTGVTMKPVVVFPQKANLSWEGSSDPDIPVIRRKELIRTVRELSENAEAVLADSQIDELYHQLADESIELERSRG